MRLFAIDCNGLGHWLFHSKRMDDVGNEIDLAAATRRWWASFVQSVGPTHAVAVFDGPNNWRIKMHTEYKSSRIARPADEEKKAALKTLPACWRELGVHVACFDGFEADDAIGSLANAFAGDECEVIVVSSDKDMMQLVGAGVRQYDPRPNKAGECVFYDEAAVEEKLGVPPHRVCDLLALMGDSSDDVPGVDGWGKVRAINAVRQTSSSRELFRLAEHGKLQRIDEKAQHALVSHRAAFDLSHKLVSLRFDVPISTNIADYVVHPQTQQGAA